MSFVYTSSPVESPQMTLCLPRHHRSPGLLKTGCFSSSSRSKSSSLTSLLCSLLKSWSISGGSKPVLPRSKSLFPMSSNSCARRSSSHAPVILFSAMFSAFSLTLSTSTMAQGTSVYPSSIATVSRWWPPMMVMSWLTTKGSAKPNSSMLFLIFSYSLSPGFSFFLGLYSAGFKTDTGRTFSSAVFTQAPP